MFPYYMHNTRELITIDAPQQGANIPIGLQYAYTYLKNLALPFDMGTLGVFDQYEHLLNGSAKQMLLYHIATDQFPGAPIANSTFGPSAEKIKLDEELRAMGDYPKYCKLFALSNGNGHGLPQQHWWDGNDRTPNDHILKLHTDMYLRVLGIKIVGSVLDIDVRTNPKGSGQVFFVGYGVSHWKIKLKWFGVKLQWWTDYAIKIDRGAKDVLPYCTSAGSFSSDELVGSYQPKHPSIGGGLFTIFGLHKSNNGNGLLTADTHIGVPMITSMNADFSAYSDGTVFGFIPTKSSFDYRGKPDVLDEDLVSMPIADVLKQTPYDAVLFNADEKETPDLSMPNYNMNNHNHLDEQNPVYGKVQTCGNPGQTAQIFSYLLNREIGDDSLYLENRIAGFSGMIEAERDVLINYRNPHYNYESQLASDTAYTPDKYAPYLGGAVVFSKQNPYVLANVGQFKGNHTVSINPADPLLGQYNLYQGYMSVCCQDYAQRAAPPQTVGKQPVQQSLLSVFPNPITGNVFTVKYRMKEQGKVTLTLCDLTGRVLSSFTPGFADNTQTCYYTLPTNQLHLATGVYLLKLNNGVESQVARISIIQ
jgi:hypothetical protein